MSCLFNIIQRCAELLCQSKKKVNSIESDDSKKKSFQHWNIQLVGWM